MRFADPLTCPDCRGPIQGADRCPSCGLDLTDPAMRQLWQTLLRADALLEEATARRDAADRPADPDPAPRPAEPAPGPIDPIAVGPLPRPTPPAPLGAPAAPRAARSWDVGTVLLGLGALGLVVAAVIFVSRSWDSIGLLGKAAVLLAATVAATAAAVWVTRRPLRASAEALWAVALALLALDLLGARNENLFGLEAVPWPWFAAASGAVVAVAGAVVVRWARHWVEVELVTAALGATVGVALAGAGTAFIGDLRPFWHVFAALVVTGVLGLALRPSGSRLVAWGARALLGVWFLLAAATALVEAVDDPGIKGLVTEGHGAPLLVVSVAAVAVGAAVAAVRVPMTAIAVVGVGLLAVLPSADSWQTGGGWAATALVVLAASLVGSIGSGAWTRGVRWGAGVGAAALAVLGLVWIGGALDLAGRAVERAGRLDPAARVPDTAAGMGASAAIVTAVAAVAAVLVAGRWFDSHVAARHPVAGAVAAVAVVGAAVEIGPPWWTLAGVLVVVAAVSATAAVRLPSTTLLVVAAASTALALAVAAVDAAVLGPTWIAVAVGGAVVSLRPDGSTVARRAIAVPVVPVLATGVGAVVLAAGGPDAAASLAAVAAAVVALGLATWSTDVVRPYLEGGAIGAAVVAATSPDSALVASVGWTILGATLCALAAARPERRWYVWPGVGALVVAYVLLVVDSGFAFVEAYTLPLAAIAVAGGVVVLRRRRSTHSWVALGPGLVLALAPSLPQALAAPTSLRALALGLAAVVVLAVGLRLGLQAPFLLGAAVTSLVVLFNVGPYANAAPRVVIISLVSAVLVALGITWEDRVRDGRRAVSLVRQMR